jgi:hypothetical protein
MKVQDKALVSVSSSCYRNPQFPRRFCVDKDSVFSIWRGICVPNKSNNISHTINYSIDIRIYETTVEIKSEGL